MTCYFRFSTAYAMVLVTFGDELGNLTVASATCIAMYVRRHRSIMSTHQQSCERRLEQESAITPLIGDPDGLQ